MWSEDIQQRVVETDREIDRWNSVCLQVSLRFRNNIILLQPTCNLRVLAFIL